MYILRVISWIVVIAIALKALYVAAILGTIFLPVTAAIAIVALTAWSLRKFGISEKRLNRAIDEKRKLMGYSS